MKLSISHSQAEQFNQCEYKFKYATMDKLEPNVRGEALQTGTNGHAFFEAFFKGIKEYMSIEEATMSGYLAMQEDNAKIAVRVMPLVTKWVNNNWRGNLEHVWEVILVEETHRIELRELGQFPFTMDLIIKDKKTGQHYMVDHKFLGQFYSQEVIDLMPQMPKYIAAFESKMGIKFAGAIYNMVCTRVNATEESLFRMVRFKVSDARKNNAMFEQVETLKSIREVVEGRRLPVRSVNKMNCGHCGFRQLCNAEINGETAELQFIKDTLYQENTYGYEYVEPTDQS